MTIAKRYTEITGKPAYHLGNVQPTIDFCTWLKENLEKLLPVRKFAKIKKPYLVYIGDVGDECEIHHENYHEFTVYVKDPKTKKEEFRAIVPREYFERELREEIYWGALK